MEMISFQNKVEIYLIGRKVSIVLSKSGEKYIT